VSALDLAAKLDREGIAVRNGHHCCQPLVERFGISGTVRASFGLYNTLEEADAFADVVQEIAKSGRKRPVAVAANGSEAAYPQAVAATPGQAAGSIIEDFELMESWTDRYDYIIDLGRKLLFMPDRFKTEENRVHGCQSTVFLSLRKKPGTVDVVEFLADSDADIVRGLDARSDVGGSAAAVGVVLDTSIIAQAWATRACHRDKPIRD
jgi:cysteine desulfurase/selenocysteine lyase